MKNTINTILAILMLGGATAAYAASGAESEGSSFILILFIGFGALIVAFQFFPGAMLFFSMIKGLFSSAPKQSAISTGDKGDRAS